MATFQKTFTFQKDATHIYEIVLAHLEDFLKWPVLGKVHVRKNLKKKTIFLKGKLFSAKIFCHPKQLQIEVELSFFAKLFQKTIEERIIHWVQNKLL